jgi:hypothetical protein
MVVPPKQRVLRLQWPGGLLVSAGVLCRRRAEKNLAHLARRTAGDRTLARPRQRLVDISGFKYPETADVLLGFDVRPVADEHFAVGLGPQRLGDGGDVMDGNRPSSTSGFLTRDGPPA